MSGPVWRGMGVGLPRVQLAACMSCELAQLGSKLAAGRQAAGGKQLCPNRPQTMQVHSWAPCVATGTRTHATEHVEAAHVCQLADAMRNFLPTSTSHVQLDCFYGRAPVQG